VRNIVTSKMDLLKAAVLLLAAQQNTVMLAEIELMANSIAISTISSVRKLLLLLIRQYVYI